MREIEKKKGKRERRGGSEYIQRWMGWVGHRRKRGGYFDMICTLRRILERAWRREKI